MEIPGRKPVTCGNLPDPKDGAFSMDNLYERDSSAAPDERQFGSSGLKESDRTIMIEDVLEKSFR